MRVEKGTRVIIGSLIMAAGTAIADVHMFRGHVLVVVTGILLVAFGYWIVDSDIRYDALPNVSSLSIQHPSIGRLRNRTLYFGIRLLSAFLIAQGFVIGAQTTVSPNITDMITSGVFGVVGYVVGHYAVTHEEVL